MTPTVEVEHKSYWAIKSFNQSVDQAGLHRKLQIQEMEEIRLDSFDNVAIYKEKVRIWHDKMISLEALRKETRSLCSKIGSNISGKVAIPVVRSLHCEESASTRAVDVETPNSGKFIKVSGQRIKVYHEGMQGLEEEEEIRLEDPVYKD
ncbi:uncharacterized protein LOC141649360 [Silene latifolia]|uniref:uncharacterized protein LOC141649360 n=1 Tax=Silene latifolia TaxID=37657 RepID=UPI003D76B318